MRQQVLSRERELAASREQHTKTSAALAAAEAHQNAAQRVLEDSRQTYAENLRAAREAQEKALADLRETFKALSADALKQSANSRRPPKAIWPRGSKPSLLWCSR